MNLIPLTLLFIMIFAFLSTMRNQEYKGSLLSNHLFYNAAEHNQALVAKELKKRADTLHHALNQRSGKKGGAKAYECLMIASLAPHKDQITQEERLKTTKLLFRKLITNLYEKQFFFQEAFPSDEALDDFIEAIHSGMVHLQNLGMLKRIQDVGNAPMRTTALQTVLYKMLKGKMASVTQEDNEEDVVVEVQDPEGYPSLMQYISLFNRNMLVSVYGAKPEVLATIFENPETIQRIGRIKKENKKKLRAAKSEERAQLIQTLNAEFRLQFEKELPSGVNPQFIDFTISGA